MELSLRKYTKIPEEDNGGQSGAEMCTKCVFLEHIRAFAAGHVWYGKEKANSDIKCVLFLFSLLRIFYVPI